VIDGAKDDVWAQASGVVTSKKISGSADGAKATIYQLWKDNYLYVLADVTDPTIDTSSGNAYEQDSVEIFTDLGNAKNGSYRADDAQMRISAAGAVSFGAGDSEAAQQARLTSATSRTATGYRVEARIDLKDTTGVGKFEGIDYEVNDGTAGARTANFGWAEQTGSAYQTTSRWGVAKLIGPAGGVSNPGDGGSNPGDGGSNPGDGGSNPGDGGSTGGSGSGSGSTGGAGSGSGPSAPTLGATPTAKVDGRAVPGGKLLVSGTGFTPGELVSIVLHSTPVTLGVVSAGSSGAVAQTVTIPASIDPGAHHIELTGLTSGVVVSIPLTVYATAAADPGSLPVTGTDVTTWLLLALTLLVAGGLLLVRRCATLT
jgi:endo-1,4-beta-xylanase